MTPEEAADYTKVHYTTLLRWVKSGKLKVSRPGEPGSRVVRICLSDLNDYMEGKEDAVS